MQPIKIIAVGKIRNRHIGALITDFTKRIQHDVKLEILETRDSSRQAEGKKMIDILKKESGAVIALSQEGKACSSEQLADQLRRANRKLIFIVGGPDGLSRELKSCASQIMSVSLMTFPHEIARLLLLEQLYRAISINLNRKYHK